MKMPVYSIRDVLNGYSAPMVDVNDNTAIRNFKFSLAGDSVVGANASDYELYRLGEFDTITARFVPEEMPVMLYRGA